MTDKELKRLSRVELIDIIYELQKQKDAADVRVAQLQEKLNQGDYPLLKDHRPELNIRFFFFPDFQPVLPSHSSG